MPFNFPGNPGEDASARAGVRLAPTRPMGRRTWTLALLGAGITASGLAVGCFDKAPGDDDVGTAGSRATEGAATPSTSALLKSTLLFESGCAAVKVGPKHLLTAARCVAGTVPVEKGSTLRYVLGSKGRPSTVSPATDSPSAEYRELSVAKVHVAPSFSTSCREDACAFGSLVSSTAADVAVVELDEELAAIPTLPVDLDPVAVGDPLFVTSSECASLDSRAGSTVLDRTVAVPPTSVVHKGSPYEQNRALVSRLAGAYLVTAGPGWDDKAPGFCRTDVGGPVFRTGSSSVVGVVAGYTAWSADRQVPVTLHHTRLDDVSRDKVGAWLTGLGVQTVRSCSESTAGCVDRGYDGGAPSEPSATVAEDEGDAGLLDGGTTANAKPNRPEHSTLEVEEPEERSPGSSTTYDGDAGTKKKAAAAASCSASPAGTAGTSPLGLAGLGLALAAALGLRRRSRG